jgi:hypothetical protein
MTSTYSTVINFTVLEFLHRLSRAGLEEDIRLRLKSKYQFSSSRRSGKYRSSTIDLTSLQFPSDADILEIIGNARREAEDIGASLGIETNMPNVFDSMPEVEEEDEVGNEELEQDESTAGCRDLQNDPEPGAS